MLIEDGRKYRALFREVVEDCIIGKISKEQALLLLKSRYNIEQERLLLNEKNKPNVFDIVRKDGKIRSVPREYKPKEAVVGKEINLLELYKKHTTEFKDCYSDYKKEIENIPDTLKTEPQQHPQNKLIDTMIEKGILTKDRVPTKCLDDVACFMIKEGQVVTIKSLMDLNIKKSNGKPYLKAVSSLGSRPKVNVTGK